MVNRNSQFFSGSALQCINTPFTNALKGTAITGDKIPTTGTRYFNSFEASRNSDYLPELIPVVVTLVP